MMTEQDKIVVEMLGNLIENIKAGNIHSLGVEAIPLKDDLVDLQIRFEGNPDAKLRNQFIDHLV